MTMAAMYGTFAGQTIYEERGGIEQVYVSDTLASTAALTDAIKRRRSRSCVVDAWWNGGVSRRLRPFLSRMDPGTGIVQGAGQEGGGGASTKRRGRIYPSFVAWPSSVRFE